MISHFKQVSGNGIVHQFNPITGESINPNVIELGYQLQQISVLEPNGEFLKEILFFDKLNRAHVLPGRPMEMVWFHSAFNSSSAESQCSCFSGT